MEQYERNLIRRGRLALRGGYSIALEERDTLLYVIGLREIKRRYFWLRNITNTYYRADVREHLAQSCYVERITVKLKGEDIGLFIKAIKREARHKKVTDAKATNKSADGETVTVVEAYTKDAEGKVCKTEYPI